ncbi:MAG: M23 family metallopeptidase [bacterium]|nr:M23 family metallopeptidase [bacterium]
MKTTIRKLLVRPVILFAAVVLLLGLLMPSRQVVPVEGATPADWNHESFWHHPWGKSGVHKGIDIFAPRGTPVLASTSGLVIAAGDISLGGNVVSILGPKWRVHYYAHLQERSVTKGMSVRRGEQIGTVGNTGNAAGKPAHLHYAIVTVLPHPWRIRWQPQGWKRMHFLDPDQVLR